MNAQRGREALLSEAPPGTEPRAPWPAADARKQANIEHAFFEGEATIHFDRLPTMRNWWSLVQSDARRTNHIVTSVVRLAMAGQIKLRQEEIDVIADCVARNYNKASWADPVTATIAGGMTFFQREKFSFPFYTPPRAWFNPRVFLSARIPLLTGPLAVAAWNGLRFGAYYIVTAPLTAFFFDSMAKTSMAASISRDPRLARVQQAIVRHIPRRPLAPGGAQQPPAPQKQIDPSEIQQRDESYRRVGLPPPPPGEAGHVGQRRSPYPPPVADSAGEWQSQDAQAPAEWGASAAQPEPEQAPRQRPGLFGQWGSSSTAGRPAGGGASAQEPSRQPESSNLWDDDDLFDDDNDDDASPVSAALRKAERAQRPAGGSAWERVRQQAKADASPFARGDRSADDTTWGRLRQDAAPTERDRERTPPNQSFTYSDSDTPKDTSKAQAQKEFDALLEAERKGENGNSGRRW